MAQFTFTIPNDKVGRVVSAFRDYFKMPDDSSAADVRDELRDWIRDVVREYERTLHRRSAADAASAAFESSFEDTGIE